MNSILAMGSRFEIGDRQVVVLDPHNGSLLIYFFQDGKLLRCVMIDILTEECEIVDSEYGPTVLGLYNDYPPTPADRRYYAITAFKWLRL